MNSTIKQSCKGTFQCSYVFKCKPHKLSKVHDHGNLPKDESVKIKERYFDSNLAFLSLQRTEMEQINFFFFLYKYFNSILKIIYGIFWPYLPKLLPLTFPLIPPRSTPPLQLHVLQKESIAYELWLVMYTCFWVWVRHCSVLNLTGATFLKKCKSLSNRSHQVPELGMGGHEPPFQTSLECWLTFF